MDRQLAMGVTKREAGRVLELADLATADHAAAATADPAADPATDSADYAATTTAGNQRLSARVPSCPDWDFTDLIKHLGNFYNGIGTVIDRRLQAPPGAEVPRRPATVSPRDWLADRLDWILSVDASTPDEARMWNFTGESPGPVGFWLRRQAHETAIHRVDAELASSVPVSSIEPDVAADCVSEFFMLLRFDEAEPAPAPGFTVHLHATDLEGAEWTIDTVNRRVSRTHAKGGAALRGTAWALARWCWGRSPDGELEVFGDADAAAAWRRSIAV